MVGPYQYDEYVRMYDEIELRTQYNDKYREEPRESDKQLISIIESRVSAIGDKKSVSLVDLGCGNGNLLYS